ASTFAWSCSRGAHQTWTVLSASTGLSGAGGHNNSTGDMHQFPSSGPVLLGATQYSMAIDRADLSSNTSRTIAFSRMPSLLAPRDTPVSSNVSGTAGTPWTEIWGRYGAAKGGK